MADLRLVLEEGVRVLVSHFAGASDEERLVVEGEGFCALVCDGSLEPFVELQGRIILSGGDLGDRFMSHDITGGHAAVGASITAGPVYLRAQAAITFYSWQLSNTGPDQPGGTADGASDKIEVLSFVVGLDH